MTGIIDVGGGMRGIYSSGVYDCFMDAGFDADYCLGVSAGSANLITYVAGQRGRTYRFYAEYAARKEYMSLRSMLKNGSYINLDYVFSALSNSDGEDPLDYDAVLASPKKFFAAVSRAADGSAAYFSKDDMRRNDYFFLKASCCIPVLCRPVSEGGEMYFDGGVADPIPIEKAFADGCDKVIVVLSKPAHLLKKQQRLLPLSKLILGKYPHIANGVATMHTRYNSEMELVRKYEKQGKAAVIAPAECFGVNTVTRNSAAMKRLYEAGYNDARAYLEKA